MFKASIIAWCLICFSSLAGAETLNLAVAANFTDTAKRIAERFSEQTGHRLRISSASTGKHYAQITHGAPFDLFLAADELRPQRLVDEGLAEAETLFTYALGKLVLWAPGDNPEGDGRELLTSGAFQRLAMANPKTAPYGLAAKEALQQLQLWERLQKTVARGENIGQAYQYVASGSADLGLVALSQVRAAGEVEGLLWELPQTLYTPIRQQAVLLTQARQKETALEFIAFLKSPEVRQLIRERGYETEQAAM